MAKWYEEQLRKTLVKILGGYKDRANRARR